MADSYDDIWYIHSRSQFCRIFNTIEKFPYYLAYWEKQTNQDTKSILQDIQIGKDCTHVLAMVSLDGVIVGGPADCTHFEGRNYFLFMLIALTPTSGADTYLAYWNNEWVLFYFSMVFFSFNNECAFCVKSKNFFF